MQIVGTFCEDCGEDTMDSAGFCVICDNPKHLTRKGWQSGRMAGFYDNLEQDAEYYENGEYYEGVFPIPETTKEHWYDNEVSNIAFKIPLTLNTLVDAQGRKGLHDIVFKTTGVLLGDITYSIDLDETIIYQNNNPQASSNTVIVEVEGLLTCH